VYYMSAKEIAYKSGLTEQQNSETERYNWLWNTLYTVAREHNVKCWLGRNQTAANQNNYFMGFSPHNADL
jgi:hypothetical protein